MLISDSLQASASDAPGGARSALLKMAKKLATFAHPPDTRKQADRLAPLLTPDVVAALGAAYVESLAVPEPDLNTSPETRRVYRLLTAERGYALSALLLAAANADASYSAPASGDLSTAATLIKTLSPAACLRLNEVALLYPEVEAAAALTTEVEKRIAREPATPVTRWAEAIGVTLPVREHWIRIELVGDRDTLGILLVIQDQPGHDSWWRATMTNTSENSLNVAGTSILEARTYEHSLKPEISGVIEPLASFEDFPALLSLLEERHGYSYERAKASVTGDPKNAITPAIRTQIRAWLKSA